MVEDFVEFFPRWLPLWDADRLLESSQQLHWQQNQIRMFGKSLQLPRLEAMYGDEGCSYFYSNSVLLEPMPWCESLAWLRDRVEEKTGYSFQVVIGNYYRSGSDHIGWHADQGKEMGQFPAIASISLGATRKFSVKHKASGEVRHFELEHGALILMHPGCQQTCIHRIAKTSKPVAERINWTFRPHTGSTATHLSPAGHGKDPSRVQLTLLEAAP